MSTHLCTQGGGLINCGNSCFMNAGLQCYLRAAPFTTLLQNGNFGDNFWMLTDQNLLEELLRNQALDLPTEPKAHYDQLVDMPGYVPIYRK